MRASDKKEIKDAMLKHIPGDGDQFVTAGDLWNCFSSLPVDDNEKKKPFKHCPICEGFGHLEDAQAWDCGQYNSECPYCVVAQLVTERCAKICEILAEVAHNSMPDDRLDGQVLLRKAASKIREGK